MNLKIEPVMIDAALVSAQRRKRLFWVGKWNGKKYETVPIPQPENRGILLKDILEESVDEKYFVQAVALRNRGEGKKPELGGDKANAMTTVQTDSMIRIGQIEKGGQGHRIYDTKGKSVTLSANGGGRGGKTGLYAQEDTIRKLTPIECERLQGLPEIEKSCIIRVCLDNQNNPVDAENQNLKLPKVVGNVEKNSSQETALSAIQSSNINNQQINKLAQRDVLILCEENKVEVHSQGKLLVSVSGVELKNNLHHLKDIGDFVHLLVGLTSIVGKTTPFGKVVLHQKNKSSVIVENGNNVVTLYGNEIMQLAKDVENDSITLKKLLKSTTSDHFGQANREQAIITLFSYVVNVIVGYIPKEMLSQSILTFQIKTKVGYTYSLSNSQRYKCLGNAFNVDVVVHILKHIWL